MEEFTKSQTVDRGEACHRKWFKCQVYFKMMLHVQCYGCLRYGMHFLVHCSA